MSSSSEHISCRELVELVTDYVERRLGAAERSLVEEHLNLCEGCVVYVDQIEIGIELAAALREEPSQPQPVSESLLAAFREWRRP